MAMNILSHKRSDGGRGAISSRSEELNSFKKTCGYRVTENEGMAEIQIR
jgi:hypothetical protein